MAHLMSIVLYHCRTIQSVTVCHRLHTYLNWMIMLPALPDAAQNRMMQCNTRNMVKYVLQSTGHFPSTAHPVPSGPIQLQLPYICKTRKCSLQQFCTNHCQGRSQCLWVCCGWSTPPTTHSHQFQLFHESSRQQYGVTVTRCCSYSCFVLLKMGDSDARNM